MADTNGTTEYSELAILQAGVLNAVRQIGRAGLQFDGKRDLYKTFGYLRRPTLEELWDYSLVGLGSRIVEVWPEDTWMEHPTIQEQSDPPEATTAFELDVQQIIREHDVWGWFKELDVMAQLGEYGILVIGVKGVDLAAPLEGQVGAISGPEMISYLRVYPQREADILEVDRDSESPTFGSPVMYHVENKQESELDSPKNLRPFNVHASHVIHFADNTRGNRVFGHPILRKVLNFIFDSDKALGGIAEMIFRDGQRLLIAEGNEGIAIDELQENQAFKEQLAAFANQMRQWLAISDAKVKAFTGDIPNVSDNFLRIMQMIAFIVGKPMRKLFGAEMGSLASEEDSKADNRKTQARLENVGEPRIIRPFFDRLVNIRAVRPPVENGGQYNVVMPNLSALSKPDQATVNKNVAEIVKLWVEAQLVGTPEALISAEEYRLLLVELLGIGAELPVVPTEALEREALRLPEDDEETATDDVP